MRADKQTETYSIRSTTLCARLPSPERRKNSMNSWDKQEKAHLWPPQFEHNSSSNQRHHQHAVAIMPEQQQQQQLVYTYWTETMTSTSVRVTRDHQATAAIDRQTTPRLLLRVHAMRTRTDRRPLSLERLRRVTWQSRHSLHDSIHKPYPAIHRRRRVSAGFIAAELQRLTMG